MQSFLGLKICVEKIIQTSAKVKTTKIIRNANEEITFKHEIIEANKLDSLDFHFTFHNKSN